MAGLTVMRMKPSESLERSQQAEKALAMAFQNMKRTNDSSLLFSRMMTAVVLLMCAFVLYVVHHQGQTIEQQHQLIRQLYQDNQQLLHDRMSAPLRPSVPASNDSQPNTTGQNRTADGCFGGVCA